MRFDRAVRATGSPRVALTVGTQTRHATYSSWGGQRDRDQDGISIAANALSLNGGTIRATDGTPDADLTHGAAPADPNRKVDGSRTAL